MRIPVLALFAASLCSSVTALAPRSTQSSKTTTAAAATPSWMRSVRQTAAAACLAGAAVSSWAAPCSATYSAYTHREEDWQTRQAKGEIQVSNARDLKAQLAAIAPANVNSQIFCPNGPSAAVSPLMENRCGDKIALPSVYGRTEDTVGNSIPGFNGGLYLDNQSTASLATSASVGGFPSYADTAAKGIVLKK